MEGRDPIQRHISPFNTLSIYEREFCIPFFTTWTGCVNLGTTVWRLNFETACRYFFLSSHFFLLHCDHLLCVGAFSPPDSLFYLLFIAVEFDLAC